MRVTVVQNKAAANVAMYEQLLARGNLCCLVTVHSEQITKITPIRGEPQACESIQRQGGKIDNAEKLRQLFAKPYGQYHVTVCHGRIVELAEVDREAELKVQDLTQADDSTIQDSSDTSDPAPSTEASSPKSTRKRRTSAVKTKSPSS